MSHIVSTNSGNCNFCYITGLANHLGHPEQAMRQILTMPYDYYSKPTDPPTYRSPTNGMYLFAQGSEDSVKKSPYAPQFKAYIEEQKLGVVHELPPVPNPLHNGKVGILYVWVLDHKACRAWWTENVPAAWKAEQAAKKAAVEAALAAQEEQKKRGKNG